MCNRRTARCFLASSLLLALFLVWGNISAMADCPGNAAVNGNFEGGFSPRGAGEIEIANGWHPWWQEGPNSSEGYNKRPEYKPEDASVFGRRRVYEGNFSQKWFNTFGTHHAGILQQINVPANSLVTASAWVQVWSSDKDDADDSVGGKYSTRVGIDPTGGTDWTSPNIVWSAENFVLDQWVQISVQAQAQGGTVTIYLRGDAEWRVKHNDAYFDDVCVTYVAPTPRPTNTPQPTDTPTITPTPSRTPTSTPTPKPSMTAPPTATNTPPPTSTPVPAEIRVLAFVDQDGNGSRDSGEELLAGAQIELLNVQGTPIASHLTDGTEPYTFGGLKPGDYTLTETDPPGYESTSSNQWAVTVSEGTKQDISFGDRYLPSPESSPTSGPISTAQQPTGAPTTGATEPEEGEGTNRTFGKWVYGISGLVAALVALAIPIVFRRLRGRS